MGNVGDQFGFHTLIFYTVFYGCVKSASDVVDVFGNAFVITGQFVQRNLVLEISAGDFLQTFQNLFLVISLCYAQSQNQEIHQETEAKEQKTAVKKYCADEVFQENKDQECEGYL